MTDDVITQLAAARTNPSIIMVVGVGGAGGNAVNHMWNLGIKGVDFMVCNTDQQALDKSPVERKIRLEGLGAGNDPENGRKAAIESLDVVRQRFEASGTKMVFITAGMGGGTGTGASPVIAKLAKEMGMLTVGIVTSPLAVEGKIRYEQAFRGIEELRQNVDSLLIINNENILEIYGRLALKQAFGKADDILASAAKGIAEIITVESDLVNVDFADVSKVMRNSGRAHMAVATADGDKRAEAVAEASLHSPLLDHNLISGARNILLNISVANAEELMYEEVVRILEYIRVGQYSQRQYHLGYERETPVGQCHRAGGGGDGIRGRRGEADDEDGHSARTDRQACPGRCRPCRKAGVGTGGQARQGHSADTPSGAGDPGREIDPLQQYRPDPRQTGLSVA